MSASILVCNAGSSSFKFSLYKSEDGELYYHGLVDSINDSPSLIISNAQGEEEERHDDVPHGYAQIIPYIMKWLESHVDGIVIEAIGHRVVHGGTCFSEPVKIDKACLDKLRSFIPLAPLHQPYHVEVIEILSKAYPNVLQVACFDTAFHRTQSKVVEAYALPDAYYEEGVLRYGFHGLSYDYIASVLPEYSKKADQRVVVAHLGNGASLCAIKGGKSCATTMGFTPLDGLMMGTRAGQIDPGVLFYLQREKNMMVEEVEHLLYHESGLKGVSSISSDMRSVLESSDERAQRAVEMFCYQVARHIASLLPAIGGLDVLVFTGGIGEGAVSIRKRVMEHLSWLNILVDDEKNTQSNGAIHASESQVESFVIPTNEEQVVARYTAQLMKG